MAKQQAAADLGEEISREGDLCADGREMQGVSGEMQPGRKSWGGR